MELNAKSRKGNALRAMLVASTCLMPMSAAADTVTLKSADGTVNLVGEFIDFKDDLYIIRTTLGNLRVSASRVSCEGAACPVFETASADTNIVGSDSIGLGVMPILMSGYAAFLEAEPTVVATGNEGDFLASFIGDNGYGDELGSYLVTSTSSRNAFQSLLEENADIGMSARRITPKEARELKAAGAGNMISPEQEHILAIDSVVVITHPDNPVAQLSTSELGAIYSGEVTNWREVGGPDQKISVIGRQETSGTSAAFYRQILGEQSEWKFAPDIEVAETSNEVAAMVNDNPGAIGFVGYAFQRGAKPMNLVNECGIPLKPDAFAAKTGEYPLQTRLYLYNRADAAGELGSEFMSYATSSAADAVIAKAGFIDFGIDLREQGMDSDRATTLLSQQTDAYEGSVIREMMGEMIEHDRLSTTFRFSTGSSRLDKRGERDMDRLIEFLEEQPEGTQVRLVGFTDSQGAFDANRNLAFKRSSKVKSALEDFGGDRISHVEIATSGYGEIAPAACNTDEDGRAINRRVEVWIANSANNG